MACSAESTDKSATPYAPNRLAELRQNHATGSPPAG
jgi:hypothetical protein